MFTRGYTVNHWTVSIERLSLHRGVELLLLLGILSTSACSLVADRCLPSAQYHVSIGARARRALYFVVDCALGRIMLERLVNSEGTRSRLFIVLQRKVTAGLRLHRLLVSIKLRGRWVSWQRGRRELLGTSHEEAFAHLT